jgi:hypothetical protein
MFLTEAEREWQPQAACRGLPYEWFQLPDRFDDPALVRRDISMGQRVCKTCPVREQCLSTATPADLTHTVRGGLWPAAASRNSIGRPRRWELGTGMCKYDLHDKAVTGVRQGSGECWGCYELRNKSNRDGVSAHRKALRDAVQADWNARTHCDAGHELPPVEERLKPRCEECRWVRRVEKKKATDMARRERRKLAMADTMEHAPNSPELLHVQHLDPLSQVVPVGQD